MVAATLTGRVTIAAMKPYTGSPDFHDGCISAVTPDVPNRRVEVSVKGYSGKHYIVRFDGVHSIDSQSPEGMMLYALHEADSAENSLRVFTFANWFKDEKDDERLRSRLTIIAKSFTIHEAPSTSR